MGPNHYRCLDPAGHAASTPPLLGSARSTRGSALDQITDHHVLRGGVRDAGGQRAQFSSGRGRSVGYLSNGWPGWSKRKFVPCC